MRKLLILAGLCLAVSAMGQSKWRNIPGYRNMAVGYCPLETMYHDDAYYPTQDKFLYPPDMSVKESRKTRKKKRRARKFSQQLAKANIKVTPNYENLSITVSIDAENKEAFHLKLVDGKGKIVQSYLHLSPKSTKEFEILRIKPGTYSLNLYAGIERRLVSSYDVNRY